MTERAAGGSRSSTVAFLRVLALKICHPRETGGGFRTYAAVAGGPLRWRGRGLRGRHCLCRHGGGGSVVAAMCLCPGSVR